MPGIIRAIFTSLNAIRYSNYGHPFTRSAVVFPHLIALHFVPPRDQVHLLHAALVSSSSLEGYLDLGRVVDSILAKYSR